MQTKLIIMIIIMHGYNNPWYAFIIISNNNIAGFINNNKCMKVFKQI